MLIFRVRLSLTTMETALPSSGSSSIEGVRIYSYFNRDSWLSYPVPCITPIVGGVGGALEREFIGTNTDDSPLVDDIFPCKYEASYLHNTYV